MSVKCEQCRVNKYCGTLITCEHTKEVYEQGRADAIEEFADNLIGEIEAYASAGHNLDVVRWVRNYAEQMKGEV